MKKKHSQIKLSKDKTQNFYNVNSSYQHLIENIVADHQHQRDSNSLNKISLMKNANPNISNHSMNYTKVDNSSLKKNNNNNVIVGTSFDIGEGKVNYANQRLNTDTGVKKSRDLSPVFYDTFKHLYKLKNANNISNVRKNTNNNSLINYFKSNQKRNTQMNNKRRIISSTNTSNINNNTSGHYEPCITEPENINNIISVNSKEGKKNNHVQRKSFFGKSNKMQIFGLNDNPLNIFEKIKEKAKKAKSPDVDRNSTKLNNAISEFQIKIAYKLYFI